MKRFTLISLLAAVALVSCSAPANISYFQDVEGNGSSIRVAESQKIRLQPEDKLNIIVTCRDPQLTMLFNLPVAHIRLGSTNGSSASGGDGGVCPYIIDGEGNIDFPVVGSIHVAGLTREEVGEKVKEELLSRNLVKDPIVNVQFVNLSFSMMGEVARPGRYQIDKDYLSVLDAIAMAGDLTINGKRGNVRVLRDEDGVKKSYEIDMCSAGQVALSPAFYLKQNDIVYVEPNDMRKRQSTVNGNSLQSVSFWMTIATFIMTIFTFVTRFK